MWQLSVQKDLGHSLVGTVTYNGTKGTHLDQTLLPNTAASGGKPNGLQSGYTYEESNGNSIYHGASFQLMRRFRSGISGNATYTFTKSIDDASAGGGGRGGGGGGGSVIAQNWLDLRAVPPSPEQRERMILFAGRVVADKGADTFVAACAAALSFHFRRPRLGSAT